MRTRSVNNHHWTHGPAGWAPIALLTLVAGFGVLRAAQSDAVAGAAVAAPVADVRLNVNTATFAQLQLLPRIGPAMAQRIIDDRAEHGPYEDARDIQRVRGIGPKTAERIAAVADF